MLKRDSRTLPEVGRVTVPLGALIDRFLNFPEKMCIMINKLMNSLKIKVKSCSLKFHCFILEARDSNQIGNL